MKTLENTNTNEVLRKNENNWELFHVVSYYLVRKILSAYGRIFEYWKFSKLMKHLLNI